MALTTYTIRIDPRHERIRDLEIKGLMKKLAIHSPHRITRVVQLELSQIYGRLYGLFDDNPQPDQDWREGRVRPVPAGLEG